MSMLLRAMVRLASAAAFSAGCVAVCAAPAAAQEAAASASAPASAPDTWDFEGAAYLNVAFVELAAPDTGSLNPVGAGGYLAARWVPGDFPFHVFFETGGALFATGTTTSPSGTDYSNRLASWFITPGAGLDCGRLRITAGIGLGIVTTRHFSSAGDNSALSLGFAGSLGVGYRFFEKDPWATSVDLRYQAVPGAKLNALALGLRVRFASL